MNTPCRLAICDDAEQFVRLLELLFETEPRIEVVGRAHDGPEAIEMCARVKPDVLLLDVAMPVMDGIAALPQILAGSPDTRVLMLTGFDSRGVEDHARALGAHGFVLKGTEPHILVRDVLEACGVVGEESA